jgi:hypothetical protein
MRRWLSIISSLPLWLGACSSSSSTASSAPASTYTCHGPGCVTSTGGVTSDASTSVIAVTPTPDAGSDWSKFCGPRNSTCLPGSADDACAEYGTTPDAGGAVDAGTSEDADGGHDAGPGYTCRIRLTSANSSTIALVCERAGALAPGSSCVETTDCSAGSTCVSDVLVPVCRQYCCDSPDSCPAGTYCTTRNTYVSSPPGASYVTDATVPVCVPADNCNLSDVYPCPTGQTCMCPSNEACMVVRSGGLTTCITPSSAGKDAYCKDEAGVNLCAAGYVCSYSTFACLKLCKLGVSASDCPTGTSCQASNDVPSGWGVCGNQALLIN